MHLARPARAPLARGLLPGFLLCLLCSPAQGQVTDEIVVTARKKEENLQDVPISVTALSGAQMQDLGIRNNYDVALFTPNFNTVQRIGRAGDRPVIRGMNNPPDPNQGESNASYFIDGIFVSGTIATATTFAMERVEVLRGPQSAQFGRATFAGAVNYVTRAPTNEFMGDLNLRFGSHDESQLAGWLSGPLIQDRLSFLVAASRDEYGGQWHNNLQPDSAFVNGNLLTFVFDGQSTNGDRSDLGKEKTTDVLTKLSWTPGDATVVNFKYGYTEGDDSLYPTNVLPTGDPDFPNLNCFIPDDPAEPWYETSRGDFCGEFKIDNTENRKNLADLRNGIFADSPLAVGLPPEERVSRPAKPGLRRTTDRYMGEWIQQFGDWSTALRGGYSKESFTNVIDLDQQEVRAVWNLFLFHFEDRIDDHSLEYSVSSPQDARIRAKLGVYYFDQQISSKERSFTGPAAVFGVEPGTGFNDPRKDKTESNAVFGSLGIDLTARLTLDVEARYAEDDKDIKSGQRSLDDNSSQPVSDSRSYNNFTPRYTLSWKPDDDTLWYGLIAKGTKPGGFNKDLFRGNVPAEFTEFMLDCTPGEFYSFIAPPIECTEQLKRDIAFSEEEQWTYELGVKKTWPAIALTTNLSVFYIDWDNQSLSQLLEVPTTNATFQAVQVQRNVGKSEITGLELETNWIVNENLSVFFNYGLADGEFRRGQLPDYAATTGTDGDIKGKQLPDSPKHSVVTGFEATGQVTSQLEGFLRTDYLYESKRYSSASNLNWVGDRTLVNLRTGVRTDAWNLAFYVRNLLNDDTPISSLGFGNYVANPIFTTPGAPNDSTSANVYPRLYSIIPQRERDYGVEFLYRFGN